MVNIEQTTKTYQPHPSRNGISFPVYPTGIFHGDIGNFLKNVDDHIQTLPAISNTLALGTIAGATQNKVYINCCDHIIPLNLYMITADGVSSRKTSVRNSIIEPVIKYERTYQNKNLQDEYKSFFLPDVFSDDLSNYMMRYITKNAGYAFISQDTYYFYYNLKRYKNIYKIIKTGYDGGFINRKKNKKNIYIKNVNVSIATVSYTKPILDFINDKKFIEDNFVSNFLFAVSPFKHDRCRDSVRLSPAPWQNTIFKLLSLPNNPDTPDGKYYIRISPDAYIGLIDYITNTKKRIQNVNNNREGDIMTKMVSNIIRLAAAIHISDTIPYNNPMSEITEDQMYRGIKAFNYYLECITFARDIYNKEDLYEKIL